jgi:RimJ/RimL family protein N-acetyltransferase
MLTTHRLILRDFRETDWEAVLEYQSDPLYLRFYAWTGRTEAQVRAFIQGFLKGQWWDHLLYAILDHEWKAQPGR